MYINWAPSSEFVSSSIPSWQISTAHVQPFRGARDLVFCLKVPLDSLLVWASSEGSGETARMRRLAWTFAARIGYKYQIRLTRSIWTSYQRLRRFSEILSGTSLICSKDDMALKTSTKMVVYMNKRICPGNVWWIVIIRVNTRANIIWQRDFGKDSLTNFI